MTTKLPFAWNDLHDAILHKISLDWATGQAEVELETCERFDTPSRKINIVVTATTNLILPRKFPWGPSIHVNEVRGPYQKLEKKNTILEIEMQSGDVIEFEVMRIEVTV